MRFNRRALIAAAGASALATAAGPLFAQSKPKKVLILGGTGFIGPHFVKALMDGGHTVTLFNRGKRDPEAHAGVEQLLGDRDGKLDALKDRSWDVAIDNSGYYPRIVRMSAELLDRACRITSSSPPSRRMPTSTSPVRTRTPRWRNSAVPWSRNGMSRPTVRSRRSANGW